MFDLIWVGGAHLSNNIFDICIKERLNLAPCYGTTETAAMISSLKPIEFLNGFKNYGRKLKDINIKINDKGLIQIKSDRIGFKLQSTSKIKNFKDENGWWESGDYGRLLTIEKNEYLQVMGRKDNAFQSGGETIFPDLIKSKLNEFIFDQKIPIRDLKISKTEDKLWGYKFEVIINFQSDLNKKDINKSLYLLKQFSRNWPKHERPKKWSIVIDDSKFIDSINNTWKNSF